MELSQMFRWRSHFFTLSAFPLFPFSPFHPFTLRRAQPFFHLFTFSLFHLFTLRRAQPFFHPFTLSPFHLYKPLHLFTTKWHGEIRVTRFALRQQVGHTPSPLLALCHCREFVWPAYVFSCLVVFCVYFS